MLNLKWTDAQKIALIKLYRRSDDGCKSLNEFAKRVEDYGDYLGLRWCGMFIGIEKDGYTHS